MVTLILHHTLAGFGLKKQDIHRIIMDIEREIFSGQRQILLKIISIEKKLRLRKVNDYFCHIEAKNPNFIFSLLYQLSTSRVGAKVKNQSSGEKNEVQYPLNFNISHFIFCTCTVT
jgi:Zn-finger protein